MIFDHHVLQGRNIRIVHLPKAMNPEQTIEAHVSAGVACIMCAMRRHIKVALDSMRLHFLKIIAVRAEVQLLETCSAELALRHCRCAPLSTQPALEIWHSIGTATLVVCLCACVQSGLAGTQTHVFDTNFQHRPLHLHCLNAPTHSKPSTGCGTASCVSVPECPSLSPVSASSQRKALVAAQISNVKARFKLYGTNLAKGADATLQGPEAAGVGRACCAP